MKLTLYGKPITKKNSMRIISCGGRPRLIQSKAYVEYETDCLRQIANRQEPLTGKTHVNCQYWLKDRRIPDLLNLLQATADILEKAGIIDNDKNIRSFDGSRIAGVDRDRPRVEINIEVVA